MLVLSSSLASLTLGKTFRFTSCWTITRTDGFTVSVTTHDGLLTVPIAGVDVVFNPVGSFNPTARQKLSQLKERNLEVKGSFDIAAITFADLAAGRYRGAKVSEYLVDWKYPWAGPINTTIYFIGQTKFNGEYWEAQMDGITTYLKKEVGRNFDRHCSANLGDIDCTVNLAPYTFSGTVGTVQDARQSFFTSLTQADNYYNFGTLVMTSGLCNGLKFDIEYYVNASGGIQLMIPAPFNLVTGDTFNAIRGCDRTLPTCLNVFNNVLNFRGFPTIPGTDIMLASGNT